MLWDSGDSGPDWDRVSVGRSLVRGGVDHGVAFCGRCGEWRHSILTYWMLFTLYTLPQLAVSAKLLCLLMVVICGAVPSMVRSVKLFGEKSNKFVKIFSNGSVFAVDLIENDPFVNLSLMGSIYKNKSTNRSEFTLNIYSVRAEMYLCFTKKWRLVGMRDKIRKDGRCEFLEEAHTGGYTRYVSVDRIHLLAFNKRGKPVKYNPRHSPKFPEGYDIPCTKFLKKDNMMFNITKHNNLIAGGSNQLSPQVGEMLTRTNKKIRHKNKHRRV